MRYNHNSYLPIGAFQPILGRMRLHGPSGNPLDVISDVIGTGGGDTGILNMIDEDMQRASDVFATVDDAVFQPVTAPISQATSALDDAIIQPITEPISDLGVSVDDAVAEVIPGGWGTVAQVAAAVATSGASLGVQAGVAAGVGAASSYAKNKDAEEALKAGALSGAIRYGAGTLGEYFNAPVSAGVGEGYNEAGLDNLIAQQSSAYPMTGYNTAGLDNLIAQQSAAYPMTGYDAAGLDALIAEQSAAYPYNEAGLDALIKQQSAAYPTETMSPLQQLKSGYNEIPSYAKSGLKNAGRGMVTNAAINVISGRPVTPEGLLKSGISGGLGGVVGNLTDSSFLGGLTAVGANAALNKSLSPSSMSSAIPFAVSGTSRTSSQNTGYPSSSGYSGYPSSSGYSGYPSSSGYSGSSGMPNSNSQYSSDLFDPKTKLPKLPEASLFANKATDKQGGSHLQKLIQMNPQMASVSPDLLSKLTPSAQKLAMRAGGKVPQYKSGGLPHIPEFKTGATGHYVKGHGDGQSDDIPAMLADGEYVFDADTVAQLGNGSSDAGAKLLDHFRESLREHKRSAPSNKIPPKASPLTYMKEALKRHERK